MEQPRWKPCVIDRTSEGSQPLLEGIISAEAAVVDGLAAVAADEVAVDLAVAVGLRMGDKNTVLFSMALMSPTCTRISRTTSLNELDRKVELMYSDSVSTWKAEMEAAKAGAKVAADSAIETIEMSVVLALGIRIRIKIATTRIRTKQTNVEARMERDSAVVLINRDGVAVLDYLGRLQLARFLSWRCID